jgi:pimeloyl-ACP methyl ester carboxylesterase
VAGETQVVRILLICILAAVAAHFVYPSGVVNHEELAPMTTIDTGEYVFRAAVSGNPKDDPVLLLHGFPETSYMWRNLQELLSENGFYSVAPDQRGYSPDARPRGKKHYTLDLLALDVVAMADSLGIEKFHLIGHDWGSAVGWAVAASFPKRVQSWTAMSVPHPEAFSSAITTDAAQYEASSYIRMFQWPLIPERALKSGDYKRLKAIWNQSSSEEVEAYLSVLSQPGCLTAALNWYRANYKTLMKGENVVGKVSVPTLFIWGTQDPAVLRSGAEQNADYVAGSYDEYFLDAGHWLIQEAFAEVSSLILGHIKTR